MTDWKGPWKCKKCGQITPEEWRPHLTPAGFECPGKLIPFERRAGFGTYLSSANRRTENEDRPIDQRDLALAQMRDLLVDWRCAMSAIPGVSERWLDKVEEALATSPADGMIGEVRWLLAHSSGNFPHVHPGDYEGWTMRRGALLSRLGGK